MMMVAHPRSFVVESERARLLAQLDIVSEGITATTYQNQFYERWGQWLEDKAKRDAESKKIAAARGGDPDDNDLGEE